jgi:hypothetical protein
MSASARPRPTRSRRTVAAVLAAVTALALAGCDLRRETPDPTEPSPDAVEQLRRDAVDDALALQAAAGAAAIGTADPVLATLTLVGSTATEQVTALGGVYESGLPEASPSATATTSPAALPADVLALLATAASDARAGAVAAQDGGLARLLAGVSASRAQLVTRLAAALGVEDPTIDTTPPTGSTTTGGAADGSGSGDGSAASPAPTPDAASGAASDAASDAATGDDLARSVLLALVAAEDQAGYGFEVAAARLSDADRAAALASAARHRAQGDAWAARAGIAGTADDPRRVTYALGADLSSVAAVRTFCGGLESTLTGVYGDAVLASTGGSADRAVVVDALRDAAVASLAWDATPTALPGLPAATPAG